MRTGSLLFLVLIMSACVGDAPDSSAIDASASANDAGTTDGGALPDGAGADAQPARARLMYVSVGGDSQLAVVELGADGTLTAQPAMNLTLTGNPGAMAYARTARRLYIGVQPGSIETVALDGAGAPSSLGLTEGTGFPVYIATAHSESVLVTAYFGGDELKSHTITGAPPHASLDTEPTPAEEPHAARIGPSGTRFYVPTRSGSVGGPDETLVYSVAAGGVFTRQAELEPTLLAGVGPRHIDFSPDGDHAYLINEFDDSITALNVQPDGTLVPFQTVSTLASGVPSDANTCADVHVSPDGRFVYGSNRGDDTIASFAVGVDGSLSPLGRVATQARPREFDVSPDGRFIVVAGQDSGALESYSIGADGRLSTIDTLAIGANPRWVIID